MKNEIPRKIIEFQPDALEIQNERLPLAIRLCVWLPLLLTILAIVWACLARTDIVVQSTGKIVTDKPTIIMKPLERTVIEGIDVKIGDIVKKDQILIRFDPAFNIADAERYKNEMDALSAQLRRLQAEFNGEEYQGGQQQFEKWQQVIFRQRQDYYQERMHYFDEALLQIDASHKNKQDNFSKQTERLAAVQKLEKMYDNLAKDKVVATKDLIEMQITRMEMEATVDQLANDILELEHRKGSTEADKNAFIQEWRNKISEDMVYVDRNLTATQKEYEKVSQLISYVCLRAPCDAVVHELAAFSPGSAVREAEALITLIPLDGNIELESEIRPEDIGKVRNGADVRIKLNAYPFQKYGTLKGTVRNISENTLQKEASPQAGIEATYYRARITVSGKLEREPSNFRLIPGMQAQCEIRCGTRRVIEYVLYPLIKALDETAKEP